MPMDHLKSRKKPVTVRVPIVLDSEIADEYDAAKSEYDAAKLSFEARATDESRERFITAEEALDEVKPRADENTAVFVFRSLGRKPFEDLVELHPPTKDQREKAKKQRDGEINWNPDTFPQALVAAASQEPEMSEADAKEIWDSEAWNSAELLALFYGALDANQSRRISDLGKGSGQTTA